MRILEEGGEWRLARFLCAGGLVLRGESKGDGGTFC